jgi:3-hydroxyisobutyrate dehydrogenase|tara:strand:+ start:1070 stop:1933 length:864 start_codon:yes stop_codon:yes gene_type:complete
MHKVLFIGIGTMGFPMAGYLSKTNDVSVYNRSKEKVDKWLSIYQGNLVQNLSGINKEYDFVISCIGNDNDLEDITISETGCLNQLKENSVFIDHSTVSPKLVSKLEKEFSQRKVNFLDAPISGGQSGAENGTLSIMVGGNKQAFIKSEELLKSYGKKIKFMGNSGSGQLTKIINQICIAGLIQGLSEAIYFMKQTDLTPEDVLEVISSGAAQSWQMENRFSTMVNNEFDFGFAVDLMRKDLSIAFNQAQEYGIDLEVTKIVDDFYSEIQTMGGNKFDTSSLVKRLIP